MATGLRREQVRGLELDRYLTRVLAANLDPSIFGNPVSIDADDATNQGVAGTIARSDHQHQWTCDTAAALTLTGTAGEGSAATGARSDHVHSTAALPWGLCFGPFTSQANSTGYTADSTTDFSIASVDPADNRRYAVCLSSQWSITGGAGIWNIDLYHGGTRQDRIGILESESAGQLQGYINARYLWTPTGLGSGTLDVRIVEAAGASTLTFQANAVTVVTRQFWVEDIGPR